MPLWMLNDKDSLLRLGAWLRAAAARPRDRQLGAHVVEAAAAQAVRGRCVLLTEC